MRLVCNASADTLQEMLPVHIDRNPNTELEGYVHRSGFHF